MQQALFGLPVVQAALFNNPSVQQILFNNTTVQTALFAIPAVQNTLFNNTTVETVLFGNPTLQPVFFSIPGVLQALFTIPSVQTTLFNDPGVQQALFGNSSVRQILFSDTTVQQALFNNPTVQSILFSDTTVLTTLFADQDVQQALFGNGSTVTGLFNDPTVQAALFNNSQVQQVLFSISSVQTVLFNDPTVQADLFANPTVATALFNIPAVQTTLFNNNDVQEALFANAEVQQALFNIPAVQKILFADPTVQATLLAVPSVLQSLFSDPSVQAQVFADPTFAMALFSDPTVQATLFGNPEVQQVLFENPTVLEALFAIPAVETQLFSDPTVQQALFGSPGVQAAIFAIPSVQQTLFNDPTVQAVVFGNASVQQVLLSDPTVEAAIFSNPSVQAAISTSTTTQQAILGSTAVQQAIFANPAVLQSILASDPTILEQVLTSSSALGQQITTASALSTVATTINLTGTGNEVTAGLLATVKLGSGGLFLEQTSSEQVNFVSQAVSNGASIANYFLNVTSSGGNNTIVGGVLSNFTTTGSGTNNFVLEDPNLLGLSGTTLPSVLADATSTINGSGGNDTVYFVGTNLGNVAINEPTGSTNDLALDFSNFQSGSPITVNLDLTGSQTVSPGLTLSLPSEQNVVHVVGSPAGNTLIGDNASSVFASGLAPATPAYVSPGVPNVLPGIPPTDVLVQYVWLNFDNTPTNIPGETIHYYSTADENAILHGLENIYAAFSNIVQFTLTEPNRAGGPVAPDGFVTIDYNSTPSSSGNLYVDNAESGTISEYSTSDNLISSTYLPGIYGATALALDPSGNLYVLDTENGTVSEFSSALTLINPAVVSNLSDPEGLAIDSNGNLYIANAGTVSQYSPTGELLNPSFITGLTNPAGLAFDQAGNLYVSCDGNNNNNTGSGTIREYNSTGLLVNASFLSGLTAPGSITFDASDDIYVVNGATGTLIEYSYAGDVLDGSVISGLNDQTGLAFASLPQPGGQSDEIDFRNLNLSTFVKVDVNDFLGNGSGQVTDNDTNFQNLSITISAHELGHTLGLRHEDAFGPIGFGISNPPGLNSYTPGYTGSVGAFTTQNDIIASPASVGSTLADAASGAAGIGARDAIDLAFISDGTVVDGTNTTADDGPYTVPAAADEPVSITLDPSSSPASLVAGQIVAQPVSLYTLLVPNTITAGFDYGKTFSVAAVDILGHIGSGNQVVTDPTTGISYTQSVPDFYTFDGQAGQLMTFQAMSSAVTRIADPIDTVLYIYGPNGQLIASNDDQFEPSDSTILDFTLPSTGKYTIEVDVFHTSDPSFNDPSSPDYRPVAYYDAQQGDYELFMYSFAAYNTATGTNLLETPAQAISLSLNSSSGTSTYGQNLSFTATVSALTAGTVEFFDGATLLGSQVIDGGQASLTINNLTAGIHSITAEYVSNGSSGSVTSAALLETIDKATLTVAAESSVATYGSVSLSFGDSIAGFVLGDTSAVVSGSADLTTTATTSSGVGSYTITVTQGSLSAANYTFAFTNGDLTIDQADLTVTATSTTKTYGSSVPSLNYTYTGLVNGDVSATFSGFLATLATSTSNVGSYAISEGTLVATGNYIISTFNAATLTVNPAPVIVTATSTTTTYGGTIPTLTYTYTGLVNGNSSATFTGALTTTATAASNVGGYAISEGTLAATGNYTIGTFVAGTLTVNPAALVVTAANKTMTYGGTVPTLTYTYTGLVNGNSSATFTGALTTTATATSNVGTYGITEGTLAATGNYTIGTYVAATLTINPAALVVTAANKTMTYGGAVPALTYTYTGLVNGNTSATFTGALTTTATATSNVGAYGITEGTLAATGNYTIGTYVAGTLTVNPAALVVTAGNKTMTYGGAVPGLTYTYTGLVNGNTSASFTGALTTTATATSNVGTYGITEGTLAATGNYTIGTYVAGTLTVNPAALVVTAANKTMTYGGAVPALTYTYTGLVNGNTSATFTGGLTTTATATSNVGAYGITEGTLAATGNYTIGTYVAGTLTVNPTALVVTAANKTMTYGGAVPALTYTYTGLVNGNTSATFTGALITTATAASNVGGYAITEGTLAATGNYTIGTFVASTLTVNPAPLTVTATSIAKTYGSSLPALNYTYTGLVNGNTSASFTGALATTATTSSNVGTYPITVGTLSATGNYTIGTFSPGILTISPASTTTAVGSSLNPASAGQSVTFTATVSSATTTPTGTVTFHDGSTTLSSATLQLVNGVETASITTSTLAIGTNAITASYGGTANIAGSTSSALNELVNPTTIGTTTIVTTSASVANYSQALTFTAAVSANSGSVKPSGSVSFVDTTTGTNLGSVTLVNGSATLTTTTLPLGTQTITASYGGIAGFGMSSNMVSVTVTVTSSTLTSAYILDPSAAGALSLSGNARLQLTGLISVDSTSNYAISASGNAQVSGKSVAVVGKASTSGNASISPAPVTGAAAVTDPLASLPAPSTTGLTYYGPVILALNFSETINPGIYSTIIVSGNANLTLNPGIYIIQGGGFNVSGNGRVTGNGVLIDNTAGTCLLSSLFSSINISGNGNVNLTPIATGPYAGILFYQPAANTQAVALSGNGIVIPGGLIYAPKAQLIISGNGQFLGSMIVDTISISGNTILNGLTSTDATVYTPAQIRTAYGINDLALDGTGQTIAIVDAYDDPNIFQAVDDFDTQFGLTSAAPNLYSQYGAASSFLTVLNQESQNTNLPTTDPTGAGVSNWELEESLDVEWVHAIAPGAQIVLVEANSQSLSDLMAGVQTAANVPSVSVVSMSWGLAEGQTLTAADEAQYDSYFTTPAGHQGVTFVASTGDYGTNDPEYPAFSPNVLAVGGTTLTLNADNTYSSEIGWGYNSSALGGQLVGSGGGLSQYEAEPAYQLNVQSTGNRSTPDVSFVADPMTGVWVADPYNLTGTDPYAAVGGTSLSAPSWAGLILLADQGRVAAGEATLGTAGSTEAQEDLYKLPQQDFNQISGGTNGGYNASAGYNLVTGLGTPVANLLVPDLVAANSNNADTSGRSVTITSANSIEYTYANGVIANTPGTSNAFGMFSSGFVTMPSGPGGIKDPPRQASPATPTIPESATLQAHFGFPSTGAAILADNGSQSGTSTLESRATLLAALTQADSSREFVSSAPGFAAVELSVSMSGTNYAPTANADRAVFTGVWYSLGTPERDEQLYQDAFDSPLLDRDITIADLPTGTIVPAADKDQALTEVMSNWATSESYETRIADLLSIDRGNHTGGSNYFWMSGESDDATLETIRDEAFSIGVKK